MTTTSVRAARGLESLTARPHDQGDDVASSPGHAPVAPQQMPPQPLIIATGETHMFPSVQAGCMPHMQVPEMHASPEAQQVVPHVGPWVHVPEATHVSPSSCTEAS